ncbi:enoyl-CoA hydratase [Angomonas deanei]|nr:enoyl-CoA hydratase [Angomonas deanei]|eukprot:EPY42240.1 enoyl-CoA hydratase [Angomonas deanei]
MRRCLALRKASEFVVKKDYDMARVITLNRVKGLNSLNLEMLGALRELVVEQPHPSATALTILKSATPKAFSTGGDVIEQTAGDASKVLGQWSCLQGLTDYQILISSAPFVSLLNGYLMGGAAGLGFNERYRVVSETTQFAMPECGIGFFPNGGASWFLPRVPVKGLGLYLALTGARLKGADNVHAGLGTHYVSSSRLDELEKTLVAQKDHFHLPTILSSFQEPLPPLTLEKELPVLEKAFSMGPDTSVEGIIETLKTLEDSSSLAKSALSTIHACCPLSLKVTLELHKLSPKWTDYFEALQHEIYTAQALGAQPDFKEGVRAQLVEKTKDPRWSRTLDQVTPDVVKSMIGTSRKGFYAIYTPKDGAINNIKSIQYGIST